jgi:hypothetical protein
MAHTWGNSIAAIFYILSNDSDVDAIYRDRIYPVKAVYSSDYYPMIVVNISSTVPSNAKGTNGESKLDVVDLEIQAFNYTYSDLCTGQEAVRAALDYKLEGQYPPSSGQLVKVQSISFQGMDQDYLEDIGENGLYVSNMRFQLRQKRD